jgi:hypothetical protein
VFFLFLKKVVCIEQRSSKKFTLIFTKTATHDSDILRVAELLKIRSHADEVRGSVATVQKRPANVTKKTHEIAGAGRQASPATAHDSFAKFASRSAQKEATLRLTVIYHKYSRLDDSSFIAHDTQAKKLFLERCTNASASGH